MSKFKEEEEVKFVGDPNDHCRSSKCDSVPKQGDVVTIDEVHKEVSNPSDPSIKINGWWYDKNELKKVEQSNMSNFTPFYVEVDGPNHSRILQTVAFEEGYGWKGENQEVGSVDKNFLFFTPEGDGVWQDKEITHSNTKSHVNPKRENELENPTLEEFRQALRGNYDFEETIEVLEEKVKFKENRIKVGCENFAPSLVKRIVELKEELEYVNLNLQINRYSEEIPFEKIEKIYNRITD